MVPDGERAPPEFCGSLAHRTLEHSSPHRG